MGLPLAPKLITLNDTERRNGRYFALFHRVRQVWGPITSPWLTFDPFCQRQNVGQVILFSAVCDFMAIFAQSTEKGYVKERYPSLDSEDSTCATLRGHVSSS